ncbi:hypothetical protein [Jannaschia pohangensis]|uniref:Uncharacterized protein n=1 Tax=Jannaschia pohangensis TaxID=390807 RepID=A0A1I3LLK7_9RHOB|nr:hypothetical protein [Jannaschia pohangensis]SFI85628.1 hypothetical protein SAMN04488095_1571 [Jannaschia pohangensis]
MNALPLRPGPTQPDAIDVAIRTHGALRVLLAAMVALLRPRVRPPDRRSLDVPDYLRRDLGLDAATPRLPSERGRLPPPRGPFSLK